MRGDHYWMHLSGDRVTLSMVDMGGEGKLIARDGEYVVVKWPRGKHWNGNYQDRAYHPPHTAVYRITTDREGMVIHPGPNTPNSFRVEECIEWSNARPPRKDDT